MAEIRSQIPDKSKEELESESALEVYKPYGGGSEEKPTKGEIITWYFYGLCSYFVQAVLIPIVFPLIISQTVSYPPEPPQGWLKSYKGLKCLQDVMQIYGGLVNRSIRIGGNNFSPMEWTSISWITGIMLSAPILGFTSVQLDRGHNQHLIAGAATGIGALFCLPAGFVRKAWIFLPYITVIVSASAVATAAHYRHLGLMIRGFTGSAIPKNQFANRRSFGSWVSLTSTAAGCLGAVIMASFTYHMMRHRDHFTALWVVSIFSGLIWALGLIHICSTNRGTASVHNTLEEDSVPVTRVVSILRYPHAAGSLAGVFLSSFMTMCIFGSVLLYATGYLCIKPEKILFLWLTYFMVPLLALPLAHPLQQIMRLDAEKMQLMGFILSTIASGCGFYYKDGNWSKSHLLLFAAIQGTAAGLLHAFGRVLLLDCSPAGKEGSFSSWFSWVGALGACAGFAFATTMPGNIGKAFGVSLCAGIVGMIVLIFGNISSLRGAKAAGHLSKNENVSSSPVHGLGDNLFKGSKTTEVLP